MSVASSAVYKRVQLDPRIFSRMTVKIQQAVQQAITAAVHRIVAYAKSGASNVPVLTGQLRDSFTATPTMKGITLRWSALSPKGYDYARIQDVGGLTGTGGHIAPKYYSDVTKEVVREIFHEELIRALEAMQP